MSEIAWNRYGKAAIRLVKVERDSRHRGADHVFDLTIDVQLEGDFESVYAGDNRLCIATDTMKNTVYALARQDRIGSVEAFATRVADHFAGRPAVTGVRVSATEQPWAHVSEDGGAAAHAFVQSGGERWTASVWRTAESTIVTSGLANLVVMKTADSAFAGFARDAYTTLRDTDDRLLATAIAAEWTYRPGPVDFSGRRRVRSALLAAFASHKSRSVQHTLAAMGEAALGAMEEIAEITLRLPNRHHLLVDLAPFGLENPNEVFVATDAPFGLIEATIRRTALG